MVKHYTLKEKLLGFAELGRPVEWSKSLLNMFLGALMAFYIYGMPLDGGVFILGFFAVAFLWSGLYALNDYTDNDIDKLHETKKNRPIPCGKVTPKQGFFYSIILIIISFILAFSLNNFFLVLCLGAMLINQLLYTTKPFRLKSRKGFDIISGSMINPFFRYLSGLVLFVTFYRFINYPFPLLPVIFLVGLQFSGYTLYRLFSKKHDKKIKMKSSVAMLDEKIIKKIAYSVMFIGVISYLGLLINGLFGQIKWLGYLPIQYAWAIIIILVVLLAQPSIREAIKNPQKANMKSSYRLLYGMNIAFVFANLLIFIFFR